MKFMMVFEGIDRASRVMNKIASVEKKTAAASKASSAAAQSATNAATAATARQVSGLNKMQRAANAAFNTVQSGAKAAGRAVTTLHQRTLALGKLGLGTVGDGAGKAFWRLTVAASGAVTAFGGASLAAGQLIGTASKFQRFQTILETTEGSSAKAKKAMDWVSDFAIKTPYELDQVMESFVALRSRGIDPTQGLLKALGDTSAAMGVPLMQGVEAIADAVTGENERLKEFGITSSKVGKTIVYEYTNRAGKMMKASVEASNRMAIQTKLMDIFNEKYGGAMVNLSSKWDGMISNLADLWGKFELAIMNAGLFDWMQGKLRTILETLDKLQASGDFDRWAAKIGGTIQTVLMSAWSFATRTLEVLEKLSGYLQSAAAYVGGWERLAVVLAGVAFGPTLIATAAGLVQIAVGLSMLSAALVANPVVLIIAAIAAGAVAIYANWDRIAAFFSNVWTSIAAGAQAAWQGVKNWIGFDPVAALSAGWSSLSGTISKWWDSLPALEWSAIVSGAMEWGKYITAINWKDYLPSFSWPALPSFEWPKLPEFRWPKLLSLELPKLPDVASYISDFGDSAMQAIDAVSVRLGNAWSRVKAAFSFGEETAAANITVTDPATIKAAAATAALKADMQSVAAIDTSGAMAKLSALDGAAKQVAAGVTSSIRRAQAFLDNVSFFSQGAALMDTMAAGIRSRAAVAVAEIAKIAQAMRDHLPSSPAKVGPLSDIHKLRFAETIAQSIRPEPMVKAMRAAALATMAAAAISAPVMTPATAMPAADVAQRATAEQAISADKARANVAKLVVQAGSRQSQDSGSAGRQIVYSPTVNFPANASAQDKMDFGKLLREHSRELERIMDETDRRNSRSRV